METILSCSTAAAITGALLLPFLAAPPTQSQGQESAWAGQKWEYRVLRIEDRRQASTTGTGARGSASEDKLNELGAEGWELVSVRNDGSSQPLFYFKRPKK